MVDTSQETEQAPEPVAVAYSQFQQWGCPSCGYRSGYSNLSGGNAALWTCGSCSYACIVLADGVTRSSIGLGTADGATVYPELQEHPRKGTPKHGRPDTRPDQGGEFFSSRGIGVEFGLGCFACSNTSNVHNIAAFVQCFAAGGRVVALFDSLNGGARLDYRDHEPDRIQVKIGACDAHRRNLEQLDTLCGDGRITHERIASATKS